MNTGQLNKIPFITVLRSDSITVARKVPLTCELLQFPLKIPWKVHSLVNVYTLHAVTYYKTTKRWDCYNTHLLRILQYPFNWLWHFHAFVCFVILNKLISLVVLVLLFVFIHLSSFCSSFPSLLFVHPTLIPFHFLLPSSFSKTSNSFMIISYLSHTKCNHILCECVLWYSNKVHT